MLDVAAEVRNLNDTISDPTFVGLNQVKLFRNAQPKTFPFDGCMGVAVAANDGSYVILGHYVPIADQKMIDELTALLDSHPEISLIPAQANLIYQRLSGNPELTAPMELSNMRYDTILGILKCTLMKHIDDLDIEIVDYGGKRMGVNLVIQPDTNEICVVPQQHF